MSERELLIREIAQTPDSLVKEVLNFLLFIKSRTNQNDFQNPNSENSDLPSFLNFNELFKNALELYNSIIL